MSRLPVRLAVAFAGGAWSGRPALRRLARSALTATAAEAGFAPQSPPELSLVFADDRTVQALNARYRGKDKPTNVLSFPAAGGAGAPMLGDIVLAEETIRREATEQDKPLEHHLAHLVAHGFLHLLGHDHEDEAEAEAMEAVERRALARLAIPDPYAVSETDTR